LAKLAGTNRIVETLNFCGSRHEEKRPAREGENLGGWGAKAREQ